MEYPPMFIINLINQIMQELRKKEYRNLKYLFLSKCLDKYDLDIDDITSRMCSPFEMVTKSLSNYRELTNIDENTILNYLGINNENVLIYIALELGLKIPNVVYSIKEIKIKLDTNSIERAREQLDEACKKMYLEPAQSFSLSYSCLETIIKHIIEDERIKSKLDYNENYTLPKLIKNIIKVFEPFPSNEIQSNVKSIGNNFINIAKSIEDMRSDNTDVHGKSSTQTIIEDPIYSTLAINSVVTLGLFLLEFYEKNYPKPESETENLIKNDDDVSF